MKVGDCYKNKLRLYFTEIKACLSRRMKTSGNYVWKYKEEI